MTTPKSIFEAIGGHEPIKILTKKLYTHIAVHPELIPIFPADLEESERKQRLFLTQFFGGPMLYTEDRGSPMLRRRHLEFEITPTRRDAWLECMKIALYEAEIEEPYQEIIYKRLAMTAEHMMNTPE